MLATSPLRSDHPAYEPGTCNIGPAEIAARRRAGHVGALVTLIAVAFVVVIDAPAPWRLLIFVPAAAAASGYVQAHLRFCANFGMRGVFNITDRLRNTGSVLEVEARGRDRRKALQIIGLSALTGAASAIVAVLLPI